MMTDNNERRNFLLECKGVVVRTEDEEKGGFNVAIFFNEIKNPQKQKISQYLSQFIPKEYSNLKRLW